MNFNTYTIKSQEVLQKASDIARNNQQQIIQTGHLLQAIFQKEIHLMDFLTQKLSVRVTRLKAQLDEIVRKYPKSDSEKSYLSNESVKTLQKTEIYQRKLGDSYIAVEHLLLSILSNNDEIAQAMREAGFEERILQKSIKELRKGESIKNPNAESYYHALERYSQNLNELAKRGKIDPIIGRDEEIRRLLQIISRRTKNNPMLIGTHGIGKTAIVEGLAQRIVAGDIPENLRNITIAALDMGSLVAGAKYKGEFEERLKSVVEEAISSDRKVVLFIDEVHTLIGAGSAGEGTMDAANLLKPALARGELRVIGATTFNEYQKYIEKDRALERRFQTIIVDEPSIQDAISILRGIKEKYEVHHGVQIKDSAITAAVLLSHRYLSDRYLPDKAIDLMDEAASKIRIEIDSLPEELDELQRKVMQLEIEKEVLKREKNIPKEALLDKEIAELKDKLNSLKARWKNEKITIESIKRIKADIDKYKVEAEQSERVGDYGKVAELRYGKIRESEIKLLNMRKKAKEQANDKPLLREEVDVENIAEIISKWTGILLSKILESERKKLLYLESELSRHIVGQTKAIKAISDAVRRNRAGLQDPQRPIGSFIFLGTTGVGKTELAKALAYSLFNDEKTIVRIDMSEYQEKYAVSRLIGVPPGYIGHDEGGQLTEAVRKKPYSVLLLDEIEKAHPDILNILLQVLDEGRLTDSKGRLVSFKNTIIIMTSNIGSLIVIESIENMNEDNQKEILKETKRRVFQLLQNTIRPEFLNRVDEVIIFDLLSKKEIRQIVNIQFRNIKDHLAQNGIEIEADEEVLNYFALAGYNPQFGARPLKRIIQKELLNDLSKKILSGEIHKDSVVNITLDEKKHIQFFNIEKPEI